jgi:hypothetical protein
VYPLAVILSFDEAHSLTAVETDKVNGIWTKFSGLMQALHIIHVYPCFSVFLSTMGKVQQSTGTSHTLHNVSTQLQSGQLRLIPPFCELRFDQLAEKAISGTTTLQHVASLAFIAKLGCPL